MNLKAILPQSCKNIWHLLQSYLANIQYGFPASSLKLIGVTGTDGKTTTATMIYEILKEEGYKVALITSVSAKIGKKELDTGFHVTTPDPQDIPRYLRMMVDAGIEWGVLEVTSHGLDQNRVANVAFEKAVFTNITAEHLDYHKNWKKLALSKAKLIGMVKEGGDITYKIDEKGGKFIEKVVQRSPSVLLRNVCSDELVKKKEVSREGLRFLYEIKRKDVEVFIPILGEYNIANAQCAIKACENLVKRDTIVEALGRFKGVKGRMQIVRRKKPCTIIVDFAHTPNGLLNVLTSANGLKAEGRIINVFGCNGLRDFYKRPKMGKISAKLADIVIITAEDPRVEKLSQINNKILEGAEAAKGVLIKRFANRKAFRKTKLEKLTDKVEKIMQDKKKSVFIFDQESVKSREDAIELAVMLAKPDDIVIATGKGHEKSLCFGEIEYPWSDFDAIKRAIKRKYGK